jgi:hypothetical protein
MSEKHANMALCPEDTQTPHVLETGKHRIPQDPLSETGVLIRASRLLASVSCTRYRSCHLQRTAEQSSGSISA